MKSVAFCKNAAVRTLLSPAELGPSIISIMPDYIVFLFPYTKNYFTTEQDLQCECHASFMNFICVEVVKSNCRTDAFFVLSCQAATMNSVLNVGPVCDPSILMLCICV